MAVGHQVVFEVGRHAMNRVERERTARAGAQPIGDPGTRAQHSQRGHRIVTGSER